MSFDPFDHDDYRELIRGWIAARPARSQSMLARRLGISRSKVAMVLSGAREVGLTEVGTWTAGLDLEGEAADYFMLLVRSDAPISLDMRRKARTQARSMRDLRMARRPTQEQARWLSRWFSTVILEMARRPDFDPDPEALASRIWPQVEADEVREVLRHLDELGIFRQLQSNPSQSVSTDRQLSDELSRYGMEYHHTQLEHASRALDEQGPDQRFVYSSVASVHRKDLEALKEALSRFQLEVLEQFRADVDGDQVIQVQLQMFARERQQCAHR